MYINDIHILYYLCFGIIGMIIGQFIDWCNIRLSEYKKVISKDFFKIYMKNFKPRYILMFINMSFSFIGLTNIENILHLLAPSISVII